MTLTSEHTASDHAHNAAFFEAAQEIGRKVCTSPEGITHALTRARLDDVIDQVMFVFSSDEYTPTDPWGDIATAIEDGYCAGVRWRLDKMAPLLDSPDELALLAQASEIARKMGV